MTVYDYKTYPAFVKAWVKQQGKGGRGLFKEIAEHLRISSVLLSQIVNGTRQIGEDQAFELCKYIGLSETESEYFMLLVRRDRAHIHTYKKYLDEKISKLALDAQQPKNKVLPSDFVLSEVAKNKFASNIRYSLVRLACSLPQNKSLEQIAETLKMPRQEVAEIMEFLVAHGLCVQTKTGYEVGTTRIHIAKESEHYTSRQTQWRLLALRSLERRDDRNLCYTSALSISREDAEWMRAEILKFITDISKRTQESESQEMVCFNIDWFRLPL